MQLALIELQKPRNSDARAVQAGCGVGGFLPHCTSIVPIRTWQRAAYVTATIQYPSNRCRHKVAYLGCCIAHSPGCKAFEFLAYDLDNGVLDGLRGAGFAKVIQ